MRTASGHETNCFTCGAPPLFFPAGGLRNTRAQAMFNDLVMDVGDVGIALTSCCDEDVLYLPC